MGQFAPRVCTRADDVKRLEALIYQLPGNARVRVRCTDGAQVSGLVCVRPTTQAFRDKSGKEGTNGLLRLEDASAPGGEHHVWLDQIAEVYRLDSISGRFEF